MAKVFNIQNKEVDTSKCCQFDVSKAENSIQEEITSTYEDVLKIFKKALEIIDISTLFKGL